MANADNLAFNGKFTGKRGNGGAEIFVSAFTANQVSAESVSQDSAPESRITRKKCSSRMIGYVGSNSNQRYPKLGRAINL